MLDKYPGGGRCAAVPAPRDAIAVALLWLSLAASAMAAQPVATPQFHAEGRFTLDCPGTVTANGADTPETRTYAVDTKACTIDPWPAAQCKCIDETMSCDNRNEGNPDGVIINRLTGKVVHYRANWKFVGHCKRHAP